MLSNSGPVRKPDREGLVGGEYGEPELKVSSVEVDLYDWLGSDLTGDEVSETDSAHGEIVKGAANGKRVSSGWALAVDNKKADLAALAAVTAYRFGMLAVGAVLLFKLAELFGIVKPLSLGSQFFVMGITLGVTLLCGLSALMLVIRKDVARRGEKFVKRVVQLSLYAMIFMNVLMFVLLFSVFVVPDFASFFLFS